MGGYEDRKRILKGILGELHAGLPLEEAKKKFIAEIGTVTSREIFELEQSLLEDGVPAEEIKKFCNVHALLFDSSLEKSMADPADPRHPVALFKAENAEIRRRVESARALLPALKDGKGGDWVRNIIEELRAVVRHYERKEQLLFPYLEKAGFYGPSKVMWGKHDEVRGLFKTALAAPPAAFPAAAAALLEELDGMIFKEESILFPTALEKLKPADWAEIFRESAQAGYIFIDPPEGVDEARDIAQNTGSLSGAVVNLPSGDLSVTDLAALLNALPVDLTFVDADDTVKYFSEGKDRVFLRARSIIGRKVQNCHPPQSLGAVQKILDGFRDGTKSSEEFWINMKGRVIHIRYFALREPGGKYLGSLEVTQDITGIKKIEGEKRLA
ncbi:MAG TPA: PAS domain S-box protein [Elusimicrobia bacterium]|nr:PAS domain S-box protein [Elusimicrobiota bacterium]